MIAYVHGDIGTWCEARAAFGSISTSYAGSGPPQQTAIQKTDIKVGDFISALFENQVDVHTQTIFIPKTINLLPPPQVLPT